MNSTAYNYTTQNLNIPYTLTQPVIPGKQLTYETLEQQAVWHYEDFILDIMKVMDLQCIAHCTDEDYQLITIQGGDDTLIHIKPSKTLRKRLLQQKKDKTRFIKTGVNRVQQASLLPNGNQERTSNLITSETWRMIRWNMIDDYMKDDRWRDETWRMVKGDMTDERWQMARWNMTDVKDRHDIFPEDDILDIITISRYNYHK